MPDQLIAADSSNRSDTNHLLRLALQSQDLPHVVAQAGCQTHNSKLPMPPDVLALVSHLNAILRSWSGTGMHSVYRAHLCWRLGLGQEIDPHGLPTQQHQTRSRLALQY